MDLTGTPDVVIVGAGAGGGAAAWALAEAGLSVLLLEAGPRFDPAVDYPLDRPGWERRHFPEKPGSRAEILYGDLGTLDPGDGDLASFNAVRGRIESGTKRRATSIGYGHVQGVGGTTLHFVGEAHRLHPDAFRLRTISGAGADWPIGYADLEPDYLRAETVIGVAGPEKTGPRWRSSPYPLPPHPFSPGAERLAAAAAQTAIGWEANPRAALSRSYDGRPPCNYCAACSRGCPLGDKGSADVTFIRKAEATGRVNLWTGAQVTRLVTERSGTIAAVEVLHDGRLERLESPRLILAAGAVQTPRLLLASASPDAPGGVANGSGRVGRNFMETLHWRATAILDRIANTHMGLPADAISWDRSAPGSVPGLAGGYRLSHATQENGLIGPIAYTSRLIPGHGAPLKDRLREVFGRAVTVGAIGETIPDDRSRVTLHPERKDAAGVPLPVISSVLTGHSLGLLHEMSRAGRRLLAAAGATDILEEDCAWDRFTSTHVYGTCRMGTGPETGVVDANGQSFDHPNLYITDASVFPSTGGGEAPSLTIQALALRTAASILG